MKNRVILGISSSHGDSSAALIVGDQLVAAAEEERFDRVKHSAQFPMQSVRYCLETAGLSPADVDLVAVPRSKAAAWVRKLRFAWSGRNTITGLTNYLRRERNRQSDVGALHELGFPEVRLQRVEHHLAHLVSVQVLQPTAKMAMLSFDGLGDFASAVTAVADGSRIKILGRTFFPHSLGFFYTAMTQYLGFPYFGDEFKVMGLSSFGKPRYLDAMRQLVRTLPGGRFELNLQAFPLELLGTCFKIERGQPVIRTMFDAAVVEKLLGFAPRQKGGDLKAEHEDLAMSVQARFEEVAAHILTHLHAATKLDTLALSGGCAHNSVFVGKVRQLTPFKHVIVAPAAGDAGLAIGAAVAVSGRAIVPASGHWGLLGPDISIGEGSWVDVPVPTRQRQYDTDEALIERLAEELAKGKVVGLARGRMEFGPRALGNRSIICDPRHEWMKRRLNALVKHREPFRPFAASVLAEHQDAWFKGSVPSPFMEAVFPVVDAKRELIPAVVHADGSCRIQTISQATQPFYHALISAFARRTGVPMLVNTSFNDSEPIVRTAAEALDCFVRGGLDHVVIGRVLISREEAQAWGPDDESRKAV